MDTTLPKFIGVCVGLVINPKGVYQAFLRGRHSTKLYHLSFNDELLSSSVGDLRQQLKLDEPLRPASLADNAAFILWSFISVVTLLNIIGIIITPLILVLLCGWRLFPDSEKTNIPRFLNRLLSLEVDRQNALFDYFYGTFLKPSNI